MAKDIVLLDSQASPWFSFLSEYIEETSSKLRHCDQTAQAANFLDHTGILFASPELITPGFGQKLRAKKDSDPVFRSFSLKDSPSAAAAWDAAFTYGVSMGQFQKRLSQLLPMPASLRVLIVDDEPEIGQMFRDFFEQRVQPSFEIDYTSDGFEAVNWLEKKRYDAAILDVKMPVRDGREIYRDIRAKGLQMPVIIFFDAISGDEITELYKIGRPAIVEKGSSQSGMPEMIALVKKMVYFG